MTTSKKRELPCDKAYREQSTQLHKILDTVGADSLHNAYQKIVALQKDLEEEKEKYNSLLTKFLTATGTVRQDAAVKRIQSWRRKNVVSNIPELYDLDVSFLAGIGKNWDKTTNGKDESTMLTNLQKLLEKQRQQAEGIYYRFIEMTAALAESLDEDERANYVQEWHEGFVEDYNELTIGELFEEYEGRFTGVSILPKPVVDAPLRDAIPLVANWIPARLYEDLLDLRHDLGTVSKAQFNKWEDAVTTQIADPDERERRRKAVMRSIVRLVIYRFATATESAAAPEEEAILDSLLMTEEENPYSVEFNVSEKTTLLEYTRLFQQMTGAGK